MTIWSQIATGLIRAFNLIVGWTRDEGLRRQGAEKAQLETLKTREDIRRKADAIDQTDDYAHGPEGDRDILGRL